MQRLFSFRWDVDHPACVTDGLPRIRELCTGLGVSNTFFVNLGRSTNLRLWLGKLGRTREKLTDRQAVHLVRKIGWRRFATETLLGRPVGLSFVPELRALASDGHELGLHGGMDHVAWSRGFHETPDAELDADLETSHNLFLRHFGKPLGFTSPGFYSDERVMRALARYGYLYHGDSLEGAPRRSRVGDETLPHWTLPVTLKGPGTIPFLEYHGATGSSTDDTLSLLREHLTERRLVILYGHPCYEGVRIDILRRVFQTVLEAGFEFVTHGQIAARLEAGDDLGQAA